MIPSIFSFSNPLASLGSVLWVNQDSIDLFTLRPSGVSLKTLEQLISFGQQKHTLSRFTKTFEKYRLYEAMMASRLSELQGKNVLFLDSENHVFEDLNGGALRKCIDDFASESITIPTLFDIYAKATKPVKNFMTNTVFYRVAPIAFPFTLKPSVNGAISASHPFADDVQGINSYLQRKGKSTLGSTIRQISDSATTQNHSFSLAMLSTKHSHKYIDTIDAWDMYANVFSEKYWKVTVDEFKSLWDGAIQINRALLAQKYSYIVREIGLEEINPYMIQGATTLPILESVAKQTSLPLKIPGGKLLSNTKHKPKLRELEPQALNRLVGWMTAKADKSVTPIIIPSRIVQKDFYLSDGTKINLDNYVRGQEKSLQYPFLKTLGDTKNFEKNAKKYVDKEGLFLLEEDICRYQFRVESIESVILRLNIHNFKVYLDGGKETQWLDCLKNNTVDPFDIKHLSSVIPKRLIRPSNMGSRCELNSFISVQPKNTWPKDIVSNVAAKSGTALHQLSNEVSCKQFKLLDLFGIRSMPRKQYCEVPISRTFSASSQDIDALYSYLENLISKHDFYEYYTAMKKNLEVLYHQPFVVDAGSPDAVAKIRETDQPIIIDFKRRMSLRTPVPYFFEQTSRYALMLEDHVKADSFYSLIIQRPFSFPSQSEEFAVDKGLYRSQVFKIRKIDFKSEFMQTVKIKTLFEYVSNTLLRDNPQLAFLIREYRKDDSNNLKYHCDGCFANIKTDFSCRYLLEGKHRPWEKNSTR
ncbi:MAG: hypothetical protein ACOCQQ_01500 [Candidatus Nanoarchaeia archaeon]